MVTLKIGGLEAVTNIVVIVDPAVTTMNEMYARTLDPDGKTHEVDLDVYDDEPDVVWLGSRRIDTSDLEANDLEPDQAYGLGMRQEVSLEAPEGPGLLLGKRPQLDSLRPGWLDHLKANIIQSGTVEVRVPVGCDIVGRDVLWPILIRGDVSVDLQRVSTVALDLPANGANRQVFVKDATCVYAEIEEVGSEVNFDHVTELRMALRGAVRRKSVWVSGTKYLELDCTNGAGVVVEDAIGAVNLTVSPDAFAIFHGAVGALSVCQHMNEPPPTTTDLYSNVVANNGVGLLLFFGGPSTRVEGMVERLVHTAGDYPLDLLGAHIADAAAVMDGRDEDSTSPAPYFHLTPASPLSELWVTTPALEFCVPPPSWRHVQVVDPNQPDSRAVAAMLRFIDEAHLARDAAWENCPSRKWETLVKQQMQRAAEPMASRSTEASRPEPQPFNDGLSPIDYSASALGDPSAPRRASRPMQPRRGGQRGRGAGRQGPGGPAGSGRSPI